MTEMWKNNVFGKVTVEAEQWYRHTGDDGEHHMVASR